MANFEQYFPILIKHEGGYSNDPNDLGGATKYGITQQVLSEYRGYKVSTYDVQTLTQEEAKQIYIKRYWNPMRMNDFKNQQLAETVFDMGVNAGIARAGKMLQELLNNNFGKNLVVDGAIGNLTINAVNSVDNTKLYNLFNTMRTRYYTYIANRFDYNQTDSSYLASFFKIQLNVGEREKNSTFLRGWLNRVASFPYIKEVGISLGVLLLIAGTLFF